MLLIATMLTMSRLAYDVFSEDELDSVIAAGGAHYANIAFPQGVVMHTNERSPDQALGFPLIARVWGDFVGWQALNLRVLPLLAGLLTITLTYRIGYDLFAPFVGAVGTLATSVLYHLHAQVPYLHTGVLLYRIALLAGLCMSRLSWQALLSCICITLLCHLL